MKKKLFNGRFFAAFMCSLMLSITVFFFSPLEVIMMNAGDFRFPFANVWWFQLVVAIVVAIILAIVLRALPTKVSYICNGLLLGLGIAFWAQMLFMNGSMITMTGEEMSISSTERIINAVVWAAIIIGILMVTLILIKKAPDKLNTTLCGIAAALIFVQTVGFITTRISSDTNANRIEHIFTTDGEFEYSSGTNVVEFILDTTDQRKFDQTMRAYPELNDVFSGWTLYPNTTSVYSRTYPSITYMLTGEKCYFDKEYKTYVEEAFEKSDFLKRLFDASTDIRIFPWVPAMIGSKADAYITNSSGYQYDRFENLDLLGFEKNMINISLYKGLPYILKEKASYDVANINLTSYKKLSTEADVYDHYLDPDFYRAIEDAKPNVTNEYSKAYRFYHLFGTHPGTKWDENLENGEVNDFEKSLRGSLKMIERFSEMLKDIGVYDNTMIIVTADHGFSAGGGGVELKANIPATPMLMVKYPNSDPSKPLEINNAPVSHDDLFATIEKTLGISPSGNGSGKSLDEYKEDDDRIRYYYYSALYSDEDGEVALLEYEIDGDTRNPDNWRLTGNWWDINYSSRAVSKQRYRPDN